MADCANARLQSSALERADIDLSDHFPCLVKSTKFKGNLEGNLSLQTAIKQYLKHREACWHTEDPNHV